ncbi:MAG TPA: hypothetical protein VHX61_17015 [Rhizomicrobium sp.]|nr:hypothetical protein [Rhizomicrobium sp.]
MLRAGLFVALVFAGAAPAVADPVDAVARIATGASTSDGTFNRPIDLTAGFHPSQMPAAGEDALQSLPREPESPGPAESPARPPGLQRPGLPGITSKRDHIGTFRLQGVTLFGGAIAGRVDGRSAHLLLSWPTGE